MQFEGTVIKFKEGLWSYHIIVPPEIVSALTEDGKKRVICRLNGLEDFHAGFMPDGKGNSFIMLNKDKMQRWNLELGMNVMVTIDKDNTKYGMPISEEFVEVLETDELGSSYFEALTDGKKRSLIYVVSSTKNSDTRITKALIILDHLKANNGVLDNRELYEALKTKNHRF